MVQTISVLHLPFWTDFTKLYIIWRNFLSTKITVHNQDAIDFCGRLRAPMHNTMSLQHGTTTIIKCWTTGDMLTLTTFCSPTTRIINLEKATIDHPQHSLASTPELSNYAERHLKLHLNMLHSTAKHSHAFLTILNSPNESFKSPKFSLFTRNYPLTY